MCDGDNGEKLLQKARRGDETAFLHLYERHRAAVFRFAYRLLGSIDLAEDITHDCFLDLIRRPEGFVPGRAALCTYLYAASLSLAYKNFRRRQDGSDFVDDRPDGPQQPESGEPLHRLLGEELTETVRAAVAALPALQREAIILFEYEELSLAEIADIVGAAKSRLHRAREGLRRSLAPYFKSGQKVVRVEKVYK